MDIPVLNIWNESAQRYEGIPAIRGEKGDPGAPGPAGADGKTAYEYARDGGYTGTEAEFAAMLAQEPLIGSTEDYTPAQVAEAVLAGREIVLAHYDETYGAIIFSGFVMVPAMGVVASSGVQTFTSSMIMRFSLAGHISEGVWYFDYGQIASIEDIPEPGSTNIEPLVFNGAVSKTYDGSSRVSVHIARSNGIYIYNSNVPPDSEGWYSGETITTGTDVTLQIYDLLLDREGNLYTIYGLGSNNRFKRDFLLSIKSSDSVKDVLDETYMGISPKKYGALGDGVTDDTVAFQNALANNRRVFVPGGTYTLSGELIIQDNCELELSQDTVLKFTQTSGNCISMKMSASLRGNHATVTVPYEFTGNVVYVSSVLNTDVSIVPPWSRWTPSWKAGRYLTDLNVVKPDSRGFHYSVDGACTGTAVYISADGSAASTFVWGLNFSGLRIAGGFSYGIRAQNFNEGWNHEMRIEAFIDACEIGVSLEDCNNAYISAAVQPRRAYSMEEVYSPYAKHGIQLIRSRNTDLSGSRVWDWNSVNSLWAVDNMYQHISMIGNCSGTILNDFFYYEMPNYDIRSLIYTDTPGNLEKLTILQEPFTRWFKPKDGVPYFNNGDTEKELVLKEELSEFFQTDRVAQFTDKLSTAIDETGAVFNGIGYKKGGYWGIDGKTFTESNYHFCTGYIPVKPGSTLYADGLSFSEGDDYCRVVLYDADFNMLTLVNRGNIIGNASYYVGYVETEAGFQMPIKNPAGAAYITVSAYLRTLGEKPVISVDEALVFTQEGFLADSVKVKAENVVGAVTPGEGGGATSWEDLGSKYEEGVVLTECSPPFVEDTGMFVFSEAFSLVEGKEYTVNWNGTAYVCTCSKMAMGTLSGLGLGNFGALSGGENTGEPFVLGVFDAANAPVPAAAVPLDGSTTLTLSITGTIENITPVPEVYLPKLAYVIDVNEEELNEGSDGSMGVIILDTTKLLEVIKDHGSIWLRIMRTNGYVRYVQVMSYFGYREGYLEETQDGENVSALPLMLAAYDIYNDHRYIVLVNMTD